MFAELENPLDEGVGDSRSQPPISGRGGHDVLPVGLRDKVCLDQELETHLPDRQKREQPLALQDWH